MKCPHCGQYMVHFMETSNTLGSDHCPHCPLWLYREKDGHLITWTSLASHMTRLDGWLYAGPKEPAP